MKLHRDEISSPEFWTDERCFITECLNSEEVPEFSLAVARVKPSVTTQLHSLRNTKEIYIIRTGEGLFLGGDKNSQRVKKDSIVYIARNYLHGLRNVGMIPLELIWIFPTDCWEEVKYVFYKRSLQLYFCYNEVKFGTLAHLW